MFVRPSHCLLLLALALACQPRERAAGPLPQEAYVWQRAWTPAVREAVSQASDFAGLTVLAAEIDLSHSPIRVFRVGIDWQALRDAGRPVGLALRIGRFQGWGGGTGRFEDEPETVRRLADLAGEVAKQARSHGLDVREVQIDYDCPESKLSDYPVLLEAVRRSVAPAPVTVTALPSWLRQQRAFRSLSRKADGVVLQVHSLRPPSLVDPPEAARAVEEAAQAGRPFRVALPTYSTADPDAMAELVRRWTADRPAELAGLVWYRLPTAADTNNWPRATLKAVMAGRVPRREIRTALRHPSPALAEIDLLNTGEAEVPLPSPVDLRWDSDTLIAADGLFGYRLLRSGPREARLESPKSSRALRPGQRQTIAWLRFQEPAEVHIEIPSTP
ncbi:MAG: hypothetical protein QOH06_914 [Acidobacteriota bacterium]|jgi:hypothetical protein|nr:hypothetical protein [Acidobacteriota bacterium]